MRLLLVHLSDIHVHDTSDPILGRSAAIVDAIKNFEPDVDMAVVAITGDLANWGKAEQYDLFWAFLESVRALLREKFAESIPVHVVAVPGNHDVDHGLADDVRSIVVDSILSNPEKAHAESVVAACTKPQTPFFEALDRAEPGRTAGAAGYPDRLYYEYVFEHGGKRVRFLCCNVAWMSRKNEIQGKLFFPAEALPVSAGDDDLVAALFHHNHNWVEANAARQFRERIESVADVILSGHEHVASLRTQDRLEGPHNLVVEAPVLQEREHPEDSAFQAFVIDTTLRRQKLRRLAWNGDQYVPLGPSSTDGANCSEPWTNFEGNRYARRDSFTLNDATYGELDDLGVTVTHSGRGTVRLRDLFVYPDLRELRLDPDASTPIIRGEAILDLVGKNAVTIIAAADQAGKTALAKALMLDLHRRGQTPVLLKGSSQLPLDDRLKREVLKAFAAQYSLETQVAYEQLDPDRRMVIVDDYERVSNRGRGSFVRELRKFAGHVVLLANDLALEAEELFRPSEAEGGWSRYQILPMGYALRGKLVDRWLALQEQPRAEFDFRLADLERKLDTVFGQNFVPVYPVFVLSVLQAAEAATAMDMTASTHGHFYEVFIRAALAEGRRDEADFDIAVSYLAHLAHRLFRARAHGFDQDELAAFHRDFEVEFQLTVPRDHFWADLVTRRVLDFREGQYRFKYRYLYYYFVAFYLSRNITEDEVRSDIHTLSRLLHVEEYANIFLFLAHLSNEPLVIDEVLAAARGFYPAHNAATFEKDVEFVGALEGPASRVVHFDDDTQRHREEVRALRDELHGAPDPGAAREWHGAPPEEGDLADVVLDPITRLNAAMKTLQILGQILKNFPGSIRGPRKQEIAQACYDLGLSSFTYTLELVQANGRDLLDTIAESMREDRTRLSSQQAEKAARETLAGLLYLMGVGTVQRIAQSVGSPRLALTYKSVLEDDSPASVRLVDLAIGLEQMRPFPDAKVRALGTVLRKNPYALWILKTLVANHFHLFSEPRKLRESICTQLGIDYAGIRASDPNQKRLPSRPANRLARSPEHKRANHLLGAGFDDHGVAGLVDNGWASS